MRKELKPLTTGATSAKSSTLGTERFVRSLSWCSLRRTIAILIVKARSLKGRNLGSGLTTQFNPFHHLSPVVITKAAEAIIKTVQRETFKKEFDDTVQRTNNYEGRDGARARKRSQKKSNLYQLDPYDDSMGILRVGGRLRQANLSFNLPSPCTVFSQSLSVNSLR